MSAWARAPAAPKRAGSALNWAVSSSSEKSWSVSCSASPEAAPAPVSPASVPFAVRRIASIRKIRSSAVAYPAPNIRSARSSA